MTNAMTRGGFLTEIIIKSHITLPISFWPLGEKDTKVKFVYTGIRVKDLQKSVDFYTKVLGMREVGRSDIPVAKGVVVSLESEEGGFNLELNYYKKGSEHNTRYTTGEGLDHLAFQVEDMERFLTFAKKMGYPVVAEMKTEKSRWAYIEDPNGIWIEIVQ
jgi:lactoylglutathione lyase